MRSDRTTPSFEGVVILGMHRSGTSLITRLVSLLGLAVCRRNDLLVGRGVNPRGHWESKSMIRFNDQLLRERDATWYCPPALEHADIARMVSRHRSGALAALHRAHPDRPFVWKDPRTCVLLPFWSEVLEQRAAYVLIVRHPLEVSESLARRNGFTQSLSLALWERYTRQAMLGAAGRPMLQCTYDSVLAEPEAWCQKLALFLEELGAPRLAVDSTAVSAFATEGLRHSHESWADLQAGSPLSPEQAALAKAASEFAAEQAYVPPVLPAETPATEVVFDEIRRHTSARSAEKTQGTILPAHLVTAGARAQTVDESSPPASLVTQSGASAVAATLPAGGEIVVVGDDGSRDQVRRREGVTLLRVPCSPSLSEAAAMARGVEAASGRVIVLSAGNMSRCGAWYEDVTDALTRPRVVGVAPVIRFDSRPELRHLGCAFTDEDLTIRYAARRAGKRPVPVALLPDLLSAFDRKMLAAAGGLDGGFLSARAAIAELSLRLWRMGFRCCVVPQAEVWTDAPDRVEADDAEEIYDRLRIATLHFSAARLDAFVARVGRAPAYSSAAERLAASDVELRRATIETMCAFPADRFVDNFRPRRMSLRSGRYLAEIRTIQRNRPRRLQVILRLFGRAREVFTR